MQLMAGLADQTVQFAAWTTATGAPVTVTSATGGLSLWYRRGVAGLKIPLTTGTTPAVNDLATLDAAHADAGILLIAGAEHRFDLPDAAIAAGVLTVSWGGTATGITIDGGTADLIGQANASPALASVDSILTIPAALKVVNATSIAGATTQVAAAFLAQYNVANPVFTNASVNQTGDAYATAVSILNWIEGDSGNDAILTAIGTRMATFTYTTPPTVAQIATGVWQDATANDLNVANSIGKCLYINNVVPGAAGGHFIAGSNAATTFASLTLISGAIPANMTAINGTSIAGTAAYVATAFVTMFNVASPVFTVASVNQSGNAYAEAGAISSLLVDGEYGLGAILTAIGTRMATFTYTTPPTAPAIADAVFDEAMGTHAGALATGLTTLAHLDTTLVVDGAVHQFTINALELAPSGTGSSPSVIADAVCDELLAGHTIAGSAAEAITIIAGRVTNGPITTVSPVTVTGGKLLLTLTQGDAYIDGRALVVTFTDVPTTVLPNTLTSATAKLCLNPRKAGGTKLTYAATITVGTGTTKTFTISITAAESALWDVGGNAYAADIEVLIGGVATAIATIGVGGSADVSAKAK
jgi:hypothetical protein